MTSVILLSRPDESYSNVAKRPNGSVIYVSFMDPVVKGADYSVSDILAEVFPEEGQALYKTYFAAFGQPAQNILNLTLYSDLAK